MAVGRILRFDDVRGYGFIAPATGGEDVFFHANDFGDQRDLIRPDARVEYEAEAGERGQKVASVRIIDGPVRVRTGTPSVVSPPDVSTSAGPTDDDGLCDVLSPRQFAAEVTELLLKHVSSLTGAQILQIRQHLTDHARSHGWVEV